MEEYDSALQKCQSLKVWMQNPNIFAPMEQGPGGGAYGDDYVEMNLLGTRVIYNYRCSKYENYLKSSKHYLEMPSNLVGGSFRTYCCFDWVIQRP